MTEQTETSPIEPRQQGTVRPAGPEDVLEILELIRQLADYERGLDEVLITADQLLSLLFGGTSAAPGVPASTPNGRPGAYAHVVEHPGTRPDGSPYRIGGFALWFLNTSTWTGTHGVYLEDLYVRQELRGSGYGTALLRTLAQVCLDNDYRRFDWAVLDWNESAIGFYRSIGALGMTEWTVQRVSGDALAALAAG